MRVNCKECGGTGYGGMHGRMEDAYICCDNPVRFYCDSCEEEFEGDELTEVTKDYHLCSKCNPDNNDEE